MSIKFTNSELGNSMREASIKVGCWPEWKSKKPKDDSIKIYIECNWKEALNIMTAKEGKKGQPIHFKKSDGWATVINGKVYFGQQTGWTFDTWRIEV